MKEKHAFTQQTVDLTNPKNVAADGARLSDRGEVGSTVEDYPPTTARGGLPSETMGNARK